MIVYVHKNQITKEIFYVGIGNKENRSIRFDGNSRNIFWKNYVKKHGLPIVEIIARFQTREDAVKLEMALIKKYGRRVDKTGQLVNITLGGDGGGLGVKQSKETKEKRANKLRGIVHTEKSKKNMREAQNRPEVKAKHAEIKKDPIWIEKQRAAKLGKKLSKEVREKISNGNKGKIPSQETRLRISLAKKGEKRTQEQKDRMSKAFKGRIRSKEAILKAALSHQKIVLNTATGVYYDSLKDAAASIPMNLNTFRGKMSGHTVNKTPFIYA
jgi:hypothetical protein